MLRLLSRSAATWTVVGLASGLYYREMTKANGLGARADLAGTQLSVVHTHTLTLGTMMLLVLLALVVSLRDLATDRAFRWGVWAWQGGLAVTTGAMLVKGTMQVTGASGFDSPAIAGISGLGHMTLTAAFVLLFVGLSRAVREVSTPQPSREKVEA